jgi:hypothetical protein
MPAELAEKRKVRRFGARNPAALQYHVQGLPCTEALSVMRYRREVGLGLPNLRASDLDPFPAIRVQGGCRDLGQGRVHLRQLQAPHRSGTGLLAGLGFLQEPLSVNIQVSLLRLYSCA